jgi:hypothetical protein
MSAKANGTGSNGRIPIGFGVRPLSTPGVVEQLRLTYDFGASATTALTCAASAVARVQGEIDVLWRDSMNDEALSQTLVEVSHALQHAARLLQQERAIG